MTGATIELAPRAHTLAPDLVEALGTTAIASAEESVHPTGDAPWLSTLSIETAGDIAVASLTGRAAKRSGIMFGPRNVDITFDDPSLGRAVLDELWAACAAGLGAIPSDGLIRARHVVQPGVETYAFTFAGGPVADELVARARGADLDIEAAKEPGGALTSSLRVTMLDARPQGVAVACRRARSDQPRE